MSFSSMSAKSLHSTETGICICLQFREAIYQLQCKTKERRCLSMSVHGTHKCFLLENKDSVMP
jgi:hypothetical protein